jgi:hypothetical protein
VLLVHRVSCTYQGAAGHPPHFECHCPVPSSIHFGTPKSAGEDESENLARSYLTTSTRYATQWQRDLSISHENIGDVLVAQGDRPEALAAYRKSLVIHEALAALELSRRR